VDGAFPICEPKQDRRDFSSDAQSRHALSIAMRKGGERIGLVKAIKGCGSRKASTPWWNSAEHPQYEQNREYRQNNQEKAKHQNPPFNATYEVPRHV
jgi:hypothetical protein